MLYSSNRQMFTTLGLNCPWEYSLTPIMSSWILCSLSLSGHAQFLNLAILITHRDRATWCRCIPFVWVFLNFWTIENKHPPCHGRDTSLNVRKNYRKLPRKDWWLLLNIFCRFMIFFLLHWMCTVTLLCCWHILINDEINSQQAFVCTNGICIPIQKYESHCVPSFEQASER